MISIVTIGLLCLLYCIIRYFKYKQYHRTIEDARTRANDRIVTRAFSDTIPLEGYTDNKVFTPEQTNIINDILSRHLPTVSIGQPYNRDSRFE